MKKPVMIMDDDVDIRLTLADILEDEGYSVTSASDGLEGIQAINNMAQPPGLIILDLMMPNMNGHEFLKVRTENANLANIPVAYFSADTEIHNKSKEAGVESIRKPVNFGELFSVVRKHCG